MKIAIWGMGVSGVSALRLLSQTKHDVFTINSGEVESWTHIDIIKSMIDLENCLEESSDLLKFSFDQIIISPGVDRKSEIIKSFIDRGCEVFSEIELAYRYCNLPIIAVTGTNGKTTTTTMIAECLKLAGRKVFIGGNIGVPFCEIYGRQECFDIVVLELSSFQLESLKEFKADVAILLNISESHMERYRRVQDYIDAKLNIFDNQTSGSLAIAPAEYLPAGGVEIQKLDKHILEGSKLIGEHHLENLFCVEKVLDFFSIENRKDLISNFLKTFSGVEYRMQYIGEKFGTKFFNDAKSTNPHSTKSACLTMGNSPFTLIMGGKLRSDSIDLKSHFEGVRPSKVYAFGEAKDVIAKELESILDVVKLNSLSDIFSEFKKGDISGAVVFSPGFPSFDQYKNYAERGQQFNDLFEAL